jgi:hypothetical protein
MDEECKTKKRFHGVAAILKSQTCLPAGRPDQKSGWVIEASKTTTVYLSQLNATRILHGDLPKASGG